jgi:hypothetical protein
VSERARRPEALTPERQLALLREIRDGRYRLQAGPSDEAQAVLAAKLAEWRALEELGRIRARTIHVPTAEGEELRVAVAILTVTGLKFLAQHEGEAGQPRPSGKAG